MFNRDYFCLEISEAIDALERMKASAQQGELDDSGVMDLGYSFQHVINHLCRAWHGKWMPWSQIDKLDDETFKKMSSSVPNWGLSLDLVDLAELEELDM